MQKTNWQRPRLLLNSIIAPILLLLLQSCVSQKIAIPDHTQEEVTIPYRVTEVIIEDHRTGKLPMNWDLPITTIKKLEVAGHPELTAEEQRRLTELIRQAQNPQGTPSKITLRLKEGSCKIYADWKQAKEHAKVAVEIEVEELNGQSILTSNSEVLYEYNTLNALEESVVKTYGLALKNATYQSLVQLTKQGQ